MHRRWWALLLCGAASLDDQQFGKFLQQLKRKPIHGEGGIPRLLFTSHRTPRAELPPKLRENVDAWRRLNPSFAFRYFDDAAQSKFMRETCAVPRCLEAYDVSSPARARRTSSASRIYTTWAGGGSTRISSRGPSRRTATSRTRRSSCSWRNATACRAS